MRLPAALTAVLYTAGLTLLSGTVSAQGLNAVPLIAQFESSGNPAATNPSSTASGLYGMINSTWAEALSLCGGCGSTAQYPNAASAPASVQTAAVNALINQNGLQDWLCAGCDSAFTQAIAVNGGVSAFQTSGLDTNPTDFASLDASAGLQTFLTNMNVATNGQPTTAVGTATATTVPTAGALSRPFQWAWDHIMVQAQQNVAEATGRVQRIAQGAFVAIVVLWGYVKGSKLWAGHLRFSAAWFDLIPLIIVGALVAPGNEWYTGAIQFMQDLPAYFASNIGNVTSGGGIAGVFDSTYQTFLIKVIAAWNSSPWEKLLLIGLVLFFVIVDLVVALGAMFFVFLAANFLLYIFLSVGPVFLLGYLFQHTWSFFRWWLDLTVGLVIFILLLDVTLSFFSTVLAQLIDANGPGISSGTPWTYFIPNILGSVVVMNVLATVVAVLTLNVGRIHGATSRTIGRV